MASRSLVSGLSFSSVPPLTAAELLTEIRAQGGRVYRMREQKVFCLTDSRELVDWLLERGGYAHTPVSADKRLKLLPGAYQRARDGKIEHDIWIHEIPTSDHSLWQELA